MGLGFGQFMPGACLCVALAVAGTEIGGAWRLAVCMVLCLLSTFSFSGGMLCWVALGPAIWMMGGRRIAMSAAWVVMMGATLALYFHGYVKPAVHPSFWEVTRHPMRAAEYLLVFLGTPLSRGLGVATAGVFGGVVAAVNVPILWAVGRRRELAVRATPWLTLIGFGWINALAATAGRVGFGVEQAADSRYTTFALPIVIGLTFMAVMLWEESRRGPAAAAARGMMGSLVGGTAVLLVICYAITFSHGVKAMSVSRRMRLRGVAGLEFVELAETSECVEALYPNPAAIKRTAEFLNSIGYLRPALLVDGHVTGLTNRGLVVQGSLQSVERTADGGWRLAGTAVIGSGRGRAADAVALAWKAPGKDAVVFMLAAAGADKTHIADGWQAVVRREMLPAQATRITIWAVDAEAAGQGGLGALQGAVIVEQSGAMRMR
jgi:hypothetical protein